jgi:hypothetical protein
MDLTARVAAAGAIRSLLMPPPLEPGPDMIALPLHDIDASHPEDQAPRGDVQKATVAAMKQIAEEQTSGGAQINTVVPATIAAAD